MKRSRNRSLFHSVERPSPSLPNGSPSMNDSHDRPLDPSSDAKVIVRSRRRFLKLLAAGAAGAMLDLRVSAAAQEVPGSPQTRPIALIGGMLHPISGPPLENGTLVFADGNPAADLMFVGEPPGRDEDERGLPFVGVSGQLLDRFLGGIGRDRTSAYIVNVLPWRPPDNREPALAEASVCLPFLLRHIALVRPRIVVALGATAARNLLNTTEGITRLRGTWHTLDANHHTCQAMATFHPAALLRQPLNKRYVWRDFLAVAERLENFK